MEDMKFFNFLKFIMAFMAPIFAMVFAVSFVFNIISGLLPILLNVIFLFVTFPLVLYFIVKFIFVVASNDKVITWIEKPWEGFKFNFNK